MSTNPSKPGQSKRQDSTAYIGELRWKRRRAIFKYNFAKAKADNIESIIALKSALRENLGRYWTRIEQTDMLAQNVINTLTSYESLMKRLANNAGLTNTALKGLVIDAEEAARKTEEIEDFFEESIKYPISCLTPTQQPASGSPISAALAALEDAIQAAMAAAGKALLDCLKTYQQTEMLRDYIGNQKGTRGLSKDFLELRDTIHIDAHPKSKIHFPRAGCPDDRWDRTKKAYDELTVNIEKLSEIRTVFMQKAMLAEDLKDAISVSLTAAEAAAKC